MIPRPISPPQPERIALPELHFPWIECSILLPLVGAGWVWMLRDRERALTHAIFFCLATLLLTLGECADFLWMETFEAHDHWAFFRWVFPPDVLVIDELSAFQLPLASLIHLVVVSSTLRTKTRTFSLESTLVSQSLLLAIFSCRASWALVALLIVSTIPPYMELRRRRQCTRIYCLHMATFVALLLVGYGWLSIADRSGSSVLVPGAMLTVAALLRSGVFPLHLWMTDVFNKASLGTAILNTTPLVGAYAVMRLVLPIAPSWALQSIAVLSLVTAVYAAAMALIQFDARRMFCFLLLSQSSLVLVGLELVTPIGLTGALCLWLSVAMSMTGFGITLRSVEARLSRISLASFHGLYSQMPILAGFFLLTGLASIGFPATVGFVGMELLIEGAVEVYPLVGTLVVVATALCGITVLQTYFRIFTGVPNRSSISMKARPAERFAVLLLTLLLLGGGLYPQPGISSRYHAAKELTRIRGEISGKSPTPATTVAQQEGLNPET
ncbi:oxidoreductase [Rhodopirellula sp. JC740]|uniref:Oxidoreductase n=1 Tax=Rhodopirellula halodulae TaxID=2894198 RepID=A0ABS8NFJ7_9BACT|nr:oxidoreductase [Rhodopirellula sp. JC740]